MIRIGIILRDDVILDEVVAFYRLPLQFLGNQVDGEPARLVAILRDHRVDAAETQRCEGVVLGVHADDVDEGPLAVRSIKGINGAECHDGARHK